MDEQERSVMKQMYRLVHDEIRYYEIIQNSHVSMYEYVQQTKHVHERSMDRIL